MILYLFHLVRKYNSNRFSKMELFNINCDHTTVTNIPNIYHTIQNNIGIEDTNISNVFAAILDIAELRTQLSRLFEDLDIELWKSNILATYKPTRDITYDHGIQNIWLISAKRWEIVSRMFHCSKKAV